MVLHGACRGRGILLNSLAFVLAALCGAMPAPAHTARAAAQALVRPCLPIAGPSAIEVKPIAGPFPIRVKTPQSDTAAPFVQTATIDDGAAGWTWSGMQAIADQNLHEETGHAGGPGTYGEYTFSGTRVAVFGMAGPAAVADGRAHKMGRAKISIDGSLHDTVSMIKDAPQYDVRITTIDGLSPGNHVLQIAADGGWIVVDYIRVATVQAAPAVHKASVASVFPEGDYRLFPKHAPDKCLEIGPQSAHGIQLQIGAPNPSHAQIWHITPLGHETYQIAPASDTSQLIWVPSVQPDVNTLRPLILWQATQAQEQILHFTQIDNGIFRIELASNSEIVMDVSGANPADGTPVIASKWGSYDNQKWSIVPAGQ